MARLRASEDGRLLSVTDEREGKGEGLDVTLQEQVGLLHADLRVGANVAAARPMLGNSGLSSRGVIPHGAGMVLTNEQRASLERDAPVRPYRNGRDLTDISRGVWARDRTGLGIDAELKRSALVPELATPFSSLSLSLPEFAFALTLTP